jgi:hypothetical protein
MNNKNKSFKKDQIGTRTQVWNGTKMMTSGGLMKKDLYMNKHNRIVSLKKKKLMSQKKKNPLYNQGYLREKGSKGFGPKKSKKKKSFFENFFN